MNKKMSFDSIAWCYDFLSSLIFGNRIKQSQLVLLKEIKANDTILIIGGGTGWIINNIFEVSPSARIVFIEQSIHMLNKARATVNPNYYAQVSFVLGDENAIEKTEHYDVVIAFYFFDLFKMERLINIVAQLKNSLKQEGILLYADFQIHRSSPWYHRLVVKVMYVFFQYICRVEASALIHMKDVFAQHSFVCSQRISSSKGLIVSEVYQKIREGEV